MSMSDLDRWCPVRVDVLPTGDGVACGNYANRLGEDGQYRCPGCDEAWREEADGR